MRKKKIFILIDYLVMFTCIPIFLVSFIISVSVLQRRNRGEVATMFGYCYQTVLTSSMDGGGDLQKGDTFISKKVDPDKIEIGDIITFYTRGNSGRTTTHRVAGIVYGVDGETGEITKGFITKGDNNASADSRVVSPKIIIGRFVKTVSPGGAKFVNFISSGWGIVLFVILPLFLVILSDIYTLWDTIDDILADKKRRRRRYVLGAGGIAVFDNPNSGAGRYAPTVYGEPGERGDRTSNLAPPSPKTGDEYLESIRIRAKTRLEELQKEDAESKRLEKLAALTAGKEEKKRAELAEQEKEKEVFAKEQEEAGAVRSFNKEKLRTIKREEREDKERGHEALRVCRI